MCHHVNKVRQDPQASTASASQCLALLFEHRLSTHCFSLGDQGRSKKHMANSCCLVILTGTCSTILRFVCVLYLPLNTSRGQIIQPPAMRLNWKHESDVTLKFLTYTVAPSASSCSDPQFERFCWFPSLPVLMKTIFIFCCNLVCFIMMWLDLSLTTKYAGKRISPCHG